MPANGRSRRSGVHASGRNNGSRLFAMNKTVMNGTPRTNSMKMTLAVLTTGSGERRPRARSTPSGKEKAIPTTAVNSETKMPPHSPVSTIGRPSRDEPRKRMKARIG